VDIKALVEEYVRLKRSGVSWKGLCPFHNEKTPSFYVHPQRRFFHCFGCKASGDVFAFLMKIEGLTFPEVARQLAERSGVEIPVADPEADAAAKRARQREDRLLGVIEAAAGFFLQQVEDHPHGHLARECWRARRIEDGSAATFRLGYAPLGWGGLTDYLQQKGWSPRDAEEVGLIVPKRSGKGWYDRFRHRLMFPIADHQGRIVAFSGRTLPTPDGVDPPREPPAKYINSPEGPLYKKGRILFGLHEGRVQTRRTGWVLVCEGNFDLVALHQGGFANSVAPMGTALTEDQVKLLKRYAERVVLLFDGDAAGRKAVRASFDVLAKVGVAAKVALLPPGEDPDSFLQKEGAEALQKRVDAAPGIVEFLIDDYAHDANDAADKAEAIQALGPVLIKVDNPVERNLYIERVAQRFAVRDLDSVKDQLRRGVRSARASRSRRAADPAPTPVRQGRKRPPKVPRLPGEILGALLDQPVLFRTGDAEKFGELLTSPDLRAIFEAAARMVEERGVVDGPSLLEQVEGNPLFGWLEERLVVQAHDEEGARAVLGQGLPQLEVRWAEGKARVLKDRIIAAYQAGDEALANELHREREALLRGVKNPA